MLINSQKISVLDYLRQHVQTLDKTLAKKYGLRNKIITYVKDED
jgi:hypothetical protein